VDKESFTLHESSVAYMSTRLAVDEEHHLKEVNFPELPQQPKILKIVASILSIIFHPIFIPVYVMWFLINIQPYLFSSFTALEKMLIMIRFIAVYTFFPLVSVLLLKGLGFMSSIHMRTQRDRIIPYIICMIYYFSLWYVQKKQPDNPSAVNYFTLAIFIASIGGLMFNIYMKISMHAIAAGIMSTFVISLAFSQQINFGLYISIALLTTGLVCTARLILTDHRPKEIYWGLIVGIFSQLAANWFS
jgi:hypothetical protein